MSNSGLSLGSTSQNINFRYEVVLFSCKVPGDLLPPFSLAYTKGCRRGSTLLCIISGIRELEIDISELPKVFKATCHPNRSMRFSFELVFYLTSCVTGF